MPGLESANQGWVAYPETLNDVVGASIYQRLSSRHKDELGSLDCRCTLGGQVLRHDIEGLWGPSRKTQHGAEKQDLLWVSPTTQM